MDAGAVGLLVDFNDLGIQAGVADGEFLCAAVNAVPRLDFDGGLVAFSEMEFSISSPSKEHVAGEVVAALLVVGSQAFLYLNWRLTEWCFLRLGLVTRTHRWRWCAVTIVRVVRYMRVPFFSTECRCIFRVNEMGYDGAIESDSEMNKRHVLSFQPIASFISFRPCSLTVKLVTCIFFSCPCCPRGAVGSDALSMDLIIYTQN